MGGNGPVDPTPGQPARPHMLRFGCHADELTARSIAMLFGVRLGSRVVVGPLTAAPPVHGDLAAETLPSRESRGGVQALAL